MSKNYFYIIFLLGFLFTARLSAQDVKQQTDFQKNITIEGLNLYPNPVSGDKIFITSKNDHPKKIIIFDVLGKEVYQTSLESNELNVSTLPPGVYIIRITEDSITTTRKLIVR